MGRNNLFERRSSQFGGMEIIIYAVVFFRGGGGCMTGFMPSIYPDESVYSWFCRYYVHSGFPINRMALEDLLYNRHCNPSKEFIGHLNPEMEAVIKRMYPVRTLILEHTMFPQYARFIGMQQKKDAIFRMEHEFCDAHRLFAILPRSEGDQYLKYCPMCVEDDRKLYGETYWHRRHQLRNMKICTKHKCLLENSEIPAKSEQCFTLDPAETAVRDVDAKPVENSVELEYAAYIEDVFDAPVDFESSIPVSAILYFGMKGTKYMSVTGRTRNTKMLSDDMQQYYNRVGLKDTASYYQLQRTLLGNGFDFSVVCQTAFFLGIPAGRLTRPELSAEQILSEQCARNPKKEDCPADWNLYDVDMVPVVEQAARDIYYGNLNSSGRPERISERLINRYAGLPAHRLENMPRCREVLRRYGETYEQHWARRLVWAYEKLKAEKGGSPFYWIDLRRLTGIKKRNFPQISPFLEQFTNKDTADRVRKLIDGEGECTT